MPKITGVERVAAQLNALTDRTVVDSVGAALFAGGEEIRAEAAHLITENAISGKGHVPSAPGDPPNEDSGNLRVNIETTQPEPLRVEVSSNARYAVALEAGTSKMAPRPYMQPATEHRRQQVVELVRSAVNKAVKQSKG